MSDNGELERLASGYAKDAIEYDRMGQSERAVASYSRAIEVLSKLRSLCTRDFRSSVYQEKITAYTSRVDQLRLSRTSVATCETQESQGLSLTAPNVTLSEVAISDDTAKAIQESIILRIRRPDLFRLGGVRGILLHGPPGCGKTLLAAAIANEAHAYFLHVDAASVMSKWLGESERNLASIFKRARTMASESKPSIIFIDEVDALTSVNTFEVGGEVRTRTQLLNEMDSARDKKQRMNVYVIAATNKPWSIDEPFLRRFQKRIYLDLPDRSARIRLIDIFSVDVPISSEVDREEIAQLMKGYSGSDIRDIFECVEARIATELMAQGDSSAPLEPRPATRQDIEDIMSNRKPSVSETTLSYYKKWAESFGAL